MTPRRRVSYRFRLTATFAALTTGALLVMGALVFFIFWIGFPVDLVTGLATSVSVAPIDPQDIIYVDAEPAPADSYFVAYDILLLLMLAVYGAAMVIVVLVTSAVTWVVAGNVIRPLSTISGVARAAAQGDLDARVNLTGPRDEIRRLADSVDDMLDDLTRSFEAHQRFAANASHELRTPLTITQTMIDVTVSDPNAGVEEYRALVTKLRSVNTRSIETVDALLDLADLQSLSVTRTAVLLNPIVADLATTAVIDGRQHDITVTTDITTEPVTVPGDATLLRQAIGNLVSNALRHNHPGGTVEIRLHSDDETVTLAISNTGEPLSDSLVSTLAEPFVRTAARTAAPGAGRGLGLALVTAIVGAHHGRLDLSARDGGGLTAALSLPRDIGGATVVESS